MSLRFLWPLIVLLIYLHGRASDVKRTDLYARLKKSIDAVRAIDTHDHLRAFSELPGQVSTPRGRGMTLHSLWRTSYYPWTNKLSAWPKSGRFDDWWQRARHDFDDARATSFYRYMLPAFRDLYGIDFDTITTEQARKLNERIFNNYQSDKWLIDVVTRRANIELMFIDPFWERLAFKRNYRFSVPVLNVTTLMSGSHSDRFQADIDSPYAFAGKHKLKTNTFDDYLKVVDVIFQTGVKAGCVCLKSTQAYQRTLRYEHVTQARAAAVYGKSPKEVSAKEQKAFEDFMFWHVCALSARYGLPFQIHTGQARVQGSNPMLLVDVIAANPRTKFVLFHGGFPWVGETGVIAMKHRNVWIDSVWLPTLSYTTAKRAYQEWLEAVPSDRIMWGADMSHAEGIYGATEFTRCSLAEALAEKVQRRELREEHARRIGRQIMRENALKLFPRLKPMLWATARIKSQSRPEKSHAPRRR